MLAIDGQDFDAAFAGFGHDDFSGHDQNFFGSYGNVFAGANRRQGRLQSGDAHNGNQDDVRRLSIVANSINPSWPQLTLVDVPKMALNSPALSGSLTEMAAGRWRKVCSASNLMLFPAAKPTS